MNSLPNIPKKATFYDPGFLKKSRNGFGES